MTVAALVPSITYLEDGSTVSFAVPFRYRSPLHLVAERISASGVVTALAYGPDYSATGGSTDAGGTLTVSAASVAGTKLLIRRVTPRAQDLDYATGDSFPAESHELALDKAMLIDQEQDGSISDVLARALMVAKGSTAPAFPSLTGQAGKVLGATADPGLAWVNQGGADSALRTDLAGTGGAALVGTTLGGSVATVLATVLSAALVLANGLPRAVPHANFNFLTTLGWKVTGCSGKGGASLNLDIADVFNANYGALISGVSTFVSTTGNDTTGTGSFGAPFATLAKALRNTVNGNIYLLPGTYDLSDYRYTDSNGSKPKRIIGLGKGVKLRIAGDDIAAATWTANGTYPSVYETTLSTSNIPVRILDSRIVDKDGEPIPIAMAALEDEVEATALAAVNGQLRAWWVNKVTKKLYFRNGGENINSAKANFRAAYGLASTRDNRILLYATISYWENLEIDGYFQLLEQAGQTVPQVWAKDVVFRYCRSDGVLNTGGHYRMQNCGVIRGNQDGFKINNGIVRATGIEIDCWTKAMGDAATFDFNNAYVGSWPVTQQAYNPAATGTLNKNGSSDHTGDVIRIHTRPGLLYDSSAGPSIADTAGSKSWNVGIVVGRSEAFSATTVNIGVLTQGGEMWNDNVACVGVNDNFLADASGVMRNWACHGTRRTTGGGSISDYTPALAA